MPFEAGRFDFIVCRAAFKNFADPVPAFVKCIACSSPAARR